MPDRPPSLSLETGGEAARGLPDHRLVHRTRAVGADRDPDLSCSNLRSRSGTSRLSGRSAVSARADLALAIEAAKRADIRDVAERLGARLKKTGEAWAGPRARRSRLKAERLKRRSKWCAIYVQVPTEVNAQIDARPRFAPSAPARFSRTARHTSDPANSGSPAARSCRACGRFFSL